MADIDADAEILKENDAAAFIRVHARTLTTWRWRKCGPAYIRKGSGKRSVIRYLRADLLKWLQEGRVDPAANAKPRPRTRKVK